MLVCRPLVDGNTLEPADALQAEPCVNSQEEAEGDHPLNTDQNSRWKEYFRVRAPWHAVHRSAGQLCRLTCAAHERGLCATRQDAEMLEQIERDVMRTHPDMHFFSGNDPVAVRHRKVRMLAGQSPAHSQSAATPPSVPMPTPCYRVRQQHTAV